MKKLSNLGGYHRLTFFVIHMFTCSHLEDEERDWLKLGRLWEWKVVRIGLGQAQLWALVLEVLKVQFLYVTTALFTSLFRNLVNSANAHHDLGTILIHMLMIVEMFVIVSLSYIIVIMDIIHFQRCIYGHDILGVTPVFRVLVVSVNIWMFKSDLISLGQVFSFTFWSLYDMQTDPLPSNHKSQLPGHPNNQIVYSGI
jgi:hypothetical protein